MRFIQVIKLKLFKTQVINFYEKGKIEIVGHALLLLLRWIFNSIGMFLLLVWLIIDHMNHIKLGISAFIFILMGIIFLLFESKAIINKNTLILTSSFCGNLIGKKEYLFSQKDELLIKVGKKTLFTAESDGSTTVLGFDVQLNLTSAYRGISLQEIPLAVRGLFLSYDLNEIDELKGLKEFFLNCKKISEQLSVNVVIGPSLFIPTRAYPIIDEIFGSEYKIRD